MLPNPVDPLGGLVAQIVRAKVPAEEQDKAHVFAKRRLELVDLGRFLFAALVGVGEVARRLGFD